MSHKADISSDKSMILDVMKNEKPQFTREQVDDTISRIQDFKNRCNFFN